MTRETMTDNEVERLANELRAEITKRTCCPLHAGEVLLLVMAGFALDDAGDDHLKAARTMERGARELVKLLRSGNLQVLRPH